MRHGLVYNACVSLCDGHIQAWGRAPLCRLTLVFASPLQLISSTGAAEWSAGGVIWEDAAGRRAPSRSLWWGCVGFGPQASSSSPVSAWRACSLCSPSSDSSSEKQGLVLLRLGTEEG